MEEKLKGLIGRLVVVSLRDKSRFKGNLISINDGVVELHTLENVHFVSVDEIKHIAVAKAGTL